LTQTSVVTTDFSLVDNRDKSKLLCVHLQIFCFRRVEVFKHEFKTLGRFNRRVLMANISDGNGFAPASLASTNLGSTQAVSRLNSTQIISIPTASGELESSALAL
jgi:hypothetical protein